MNNREATQRFFISDVLISHCGMTLTPENIEKIINELMEGITKGGCSWAFAVEELAEFTQ